MNRQQLSHAIYQLVLTSDTTTEDLAAVCVQILVVYCRSRGVKLLDELPRLVDIIEADLRGDSAKDTP